MSDANQVNLPAGDHNGLYDALGLRRLWWYIHERATL